MFNIDFTFLWTLVNLIVLFFFLKKFLFGRVGAFMEQRSQRIAGERAAVEKERDEVKRLRETYEDKITKAGEEAQSILKTAKEKAAITANGIIDEANEQARLMIESARARVEAERQAALLVFKAEAAALVVSVSGKLLQRSIESDDNLRLARTLLDEGAAKRQKEAG